MARKQQSQTIQKRGENLKFNLTKGTSITVDLSTQKVSAEQKRILQKAVNALKHADPKTLVADGCPSQPYLEKAEFEKIRGLKAGLGNTGGAEARGILLNFCLHILALPR